MAPARRRRQPHRSARRHERRRALRGPGYFARLGPGLVTGAADDDPSGIGTYSQIGARFGTRFAWSALYLLPVAVAVQETAARLGLVTGRGLAALIRRRFAPPVLVVAVVLVATANTFNIAADLASMGAAARLVIPLPAPALATAMTAGVVTLEILVPYHTYARVLRWLALSLAAYILVLGSVRVPWHDVLRDVALPRAAFRRADIAALLALFGTTVSPYLFFWQASEEVEERDDGDGTRSALGDEHLAAMRVDVVSGMASGVFVMFAIIIAAAVTLNTSGITDIGTAEQAARALRPIAGRLAGLLFALGIVGLGLLAVPVLAGSTAYALSEALGWHEGLGRTFRQARGFYVVITLSLVGGLAIELAGLDPIKGLFLAAVLNGVAAPPLVLLMLLLARDAKVMGRHRSGRLSVAALTVTFVLSATLPVLYPFAR